jgi:nucleotide-binding universal stress UspA family protein
MFQKLMVPVDLSDRHDQALKAAAELAALAKGEITLLHVIEVLHGLSVDDDPEFYRRLESTSREHLSAMVERLQSAGTTCRYAIRFGERGPDVLKYAAEQGIDLIVLSSHPVDPGAPGAGWLSLSYLIGIGAPCNVLLIK